MSEQWGDWTDGTWSDVQPGDEIHKGKLWLVVEVTSGAVSMVDETGPSSEATPKVGYPPMHAPVRYRRRAPEPANVVAEQRPELRETATAVLDDLAAVRAMPVGDRIAAAVDALDIKVETIEPESAPNPVEVLERANIKNAAIAAAERYECSSAPFSDLDAKRLGAVVAAHGRLVNAVDESIAALAAGMAPAALGAISAVHVAFADLATAYGMALTGMQVPVPAPARRCGECVSDGEDPRLWCGCPPDESVTCLGPCRNRAHLPVWHDKTAEVEPLAGDMDAERGAVNNLRAASLEPEVIQRVLAYDDLVAHLSEKHGHMIPQRGKRTKIEARGELMDMHFAAHEKGQAEGNARWGPRGTGAGHTHPVMDRPMIVTPAPF